MTTDKAIAMTMAAGAMAKHGTRAFIIARIDEHGKVEISYDGCMMEITFIERNIGQFISRVLSGEILKAVGK